MAREEPGRARSSPMRPSHRLMLAFLVARLVFGLAFLVSVAARWPVPWYFPVERRWVVARAVQGLAMDWYGRSLVSLALGAAAGLLAYALAGVPAFARYIGRKAFVVGVAHFGALMLLNDVVFYALTLLTREGSPVAQPAWYCPR